MAGQSRRRWAIAAGVAVAGVWVWFASGVRPFTVPAEVLTFAPGLLVLLVTLRRRAEPSTPAVVAGDRAALSGWKRSSSWLPWIFVVAALCALELTELFAQPRSAHPTLSSLTNTVLDNHPGRFVGYAIWLALGWALIRDLRDRHK